MIDAKANHNTSPDYQAAVIKKAVEQCGSLKALAEKAGITYDYIGKLKNGQRSWTYALQRLIEEISNGGANVEAPKTITVANRYCAIPNKAGGCILLREDLPALFVNDAHFAELVLPVSLQAVQRYKHGKKSPGSRILMYDWLVVNYKGTGLVMSPKEAAERGLQEENDWCPDLSEWADEVTDI